MPNHHDQSDPAECVGPEICPYGEILNHIKTKLDKVALLLTGNGEPSRGMIVRLDRAERFLHVLKLIASIALTVIVGGLIVGAWKIVENVLLHK